jgi:hypothetical protein
MELLYGPLPPVILFAIFAGLSVRQVSNASWAAVGRRTAIALLIGWVLVMLHGFDTKVTAGEVYMLSGQVSLLTKRLEELHDQEQTVEARRILGEFNKEFIQVAGDSVALQKLVSRLVSPQKAANPRGSGGH